MLVYSFIPPLLTQLRKVQRRQHGCSACRQEICATSSHMRHSGRRNNLLGLARSLLLTSVPHVVNKGGACAEGTACSFHFHTHKPSELGVESLLNIHWVQTVDYCCFCATTPRVQCRCAMEADQDVQSIRTAARYENVGGLAIHASGTRQSSIRHVRDLRGA